MSPRERALCVNSPMSHGPVAQLVARLHGMQKVRGSSPLRSTKRRERVGIVDVHQIGWHRESTERLSSLMDDGRFLYGERFLQRIGRGNCDA